LRACHLLFHPLRREVDCAGDARAVLSISGTERNGSAEFVPGGVVAENGSADYPAVTRVQALPRENIRTAIDIIKDIAVHRDDDVCSLVPHGHRDRLEADAAGVGQQDVRPPAVA